MVSRVVMFCYCCVWLWGSGLVGEVVWWELLNGGIERFFCIWYGVCV